MMTTLLFALALAAKIPQAPVNDDIAAAVARGDALYERRGDGAHGAVADTAPIDAAIAAYRHALTLDRRNLDARAGLMRAIFFRGGFCDMPADQQMKLFEEAKRLADDTITQLEKSLGYPKGAARIQALKHVPAATRLYFWSAVSWGQWSVDHKLAAAWQGAAIRIRDLAQTVVDLDPTVDQGSGYLILGRLHSECPKIPMLTRWVSRTQAITYLRRAAEIGPKNSPNLYFLADAILNYEPAHESEARRLLERCATAEPRPEYLVEDLHYAQAAKERLAGLAPSSGG